MWVIFQLVETVSFLFSGIGELLPVEVVYFLTKAFFPVNPSYRSVETSFFVYWKQYFSILRFFLLVETIIGIRRKLIFKKGTIFLLVDTSFFQFFQMFFKVEAVSLYFSTNPFSDQKKQILCLMETIFFIRAIFLRVESIIGIRANQFF